MVLAGKPSIVEQLNEFIQELKDIDTSIAAHVSPSLAILAQLSLAERRKCLSMRGSDKSLPNQQ